MPDRADPAERPTVPAGHARAGAEHQLRILIDSLVDFAIYMLDAEGRVTTWNTGGVRLKGYRPDEIIGEHFSRFYTEEDRAHGEPARALEIAGRDGKYEREGWRIRKDGSRFWASVMIEAIRSGTGALIGFAKVTRDVTERRETLDKLRASEERFRLLVQGVTDYAIYMLSPDGIVTNWNAGGERIKGWTESEIVGRHFSTFYTAEDRAAGEPARALATAIEEGRYAREGWRVRKDGSRFWASVVIDPIPDADGGLIGFAKVTRDVTERKQAEEALERTRAALAQSQKMEAIGQLTGGIAHDFNNLLTVIDGNLELLTDVGLDDAKRRYFTDNARRGAERARLLTQQLLAFARLQPLETKVDDINRLITGFEPILRRALPEFIELRLDPAARPAAAAVDISQFEAALLNLTVNARDAMPNGGTLIVRTERRRVAIGEDEPECVVVSVIDDGEGIEPKNLDKIFDPFFTTKPVGKGTGLGLSQLHGFVTQLGGRVVVESTVGIGTTISMCLPAAAVGAMPDAEVAPILPTILAVDDDAAVLEIAVAMLSTLKYRVLTAADGAHALRLLGRERNIDLLFTDVAMPNGMTGIELAREASSLLPDLKVLLTSGYPQREAAQFPLLKKPYSRVQLAERLQNLLNRG
jgi:PAS domain S-box-containing protein